MEVEIRQERLTPEIGNILINFSKAWETENNCYGYQANKPSDIEGRTIFVANENKVPLGYLFGQFQTTEEDLATIPNNSRTFEIEEMYVTKTYRSKGVGQKLFRTLKKFVREKAEYLTLSTATKNYQRVLHFYIEELGMTFWYARLFKKIHQ